MKHGEKITIELDEKGLFSVRLDNGTEPSTVALDLMWDEMVGQITGLTHPGMNEAHRVRYPMATDRQWETEERIRTARRDGIDDAFLGKRPSAAGRPAQRDVKILADWGFEAAVLDKGKGWFAISTQGGPVRTLRGVGALDLFVESVVQQVVAGVKEPA